MTLVTTLVGEYGNLTSVTLRFKYWLVLNFVKNDFQNTEY